MGMHRTATGLSRHNVGVVDLSSGADVPHAEFADAVRVLMDAGFRLTNKARYDEALSNMMGGYDSTNPDVTLVSRGDVMGAPLQYATVFMSTPQAGDSLHIHTALPKETPQETLDALSQRFDGFFTQDKNGVHVGYLTIEPGKPEPGVHPYESSLQELKGLRVNTIPIPFSHHGLGLLPFWGRTGLANKPEPEQLEKIASILIEHLGAQAEVIDMPPSLKDRVTAKLTPQDSLSPSLRRSR